MHFKHLSWPCMVVNFRVLQSCQFNIAILSSLWGDRWLKTHLDFPLRGNYSLLDKLSLLHVSQMTRNLPGTSPWECLFLPTCFHPLLGQNSLKNSFPSGARKHARISSWLLQLLLFLFGFYGQQLTKNWMGLSSTLFWSKKKKERLLLYTCTFQHGSRWTHMTLNLI